MSDTVISIAPDLTLRPMTAQLAEFFGPAIAAIEPWSQVHYPAHQLTAFLAADDPALTRRAVFVSHEPAGVICVRSPWFHGPYLQLLALLPPFQSRGYGVALLQWFETQAKPYNRWLWLCHSGFNKRAGAFYARHGFVVVANLPDLLVDGEDEVLMRKRINAAR